MTIVFENKTTKQSSGLMEFFIPVSAVFKSLSAFPSRFNRTVVTEKASKQTNTWCFSPFQFLKRGDLIPLPNDVIYR